MEMYNVPIKYAIRRFEIWLKSYIARNRISNISVGLNIREHCSYSINLGEDCDEESEFCIGSVSKIFTAYIILSLILDNVIDFKTKLSDVFGSKFNRKLADITILQLLNHTSGLQTEANSSHWNDYDFPSNKDLYEDISSMELIYSPGEKFNYSNLGYCLLGLIIEKVKGCEFTQYLTSEVLQKYGLSHTKVSKSSKLLNGTLRHLGGVKRTAKFLDYKSYIPAAGIVSNHQDLSHFLLILNDLPRRFCEYGLNFSWKDTLLGAGGDISWSFGLHLINGKICHRGNTLGYKSFISCDIETLDRVVILSNDYNVDIDLIVHHANSIVESYAQNDKLLPDNLSFKCYEGHYINEWGDYSVLVEGESLSMIDYSNDFPSSINTLTYIGEKKFKVSSSNPFLDDGEIYEFFTGKYKIRNIKLSNSYIYKYEDYIHDFKTS